MKVLHSYHTEQVGIHERGVMRPKRKATSGCENGLAFAHARPYPLAVRRERLRRIGWRDRPRFYDPLDPLELEPWSGGAELGVDAAGLELGGARTGGARFRVLWAPRWAAWAAWAGRGRGLRGAPPC